MLKSRQTLANAQQFIDNLKPLLHPNPRKVFLRGCDNRKKCLSSGFRPSIKTSSSYESINRFFK
jgi:hypothetical protein